MSETKISTPGSIDPALAEAAELQGSRAFAEAAEAYRRYMAKRPLTVGVAANLSLCLSELGRFEEAESWLLTAARQKPDNPELRRLLGNLYGEMGRLDHAELELRTSLLLKPDQVGAKVNLGALLLSRGRYAEGWPLLEFRGQLNPDLVPELNVSFPEWKGEPLAGKSILVWYEQGLGDQIQMCRFAKTLKARGAAHVALGCRPTLVDLMATTPGADEIIPVPRDAKIVIRRYDCWTRFFSLPGRLDVTLNDIPAEPYLSAPEAHRARWKGASGVGLAWRASPTGFNGQNKSLPDEAAQRLLDLGVMSLDPADSGVADFADTAAIVEQLDLVISVDSSVAHLAGAMGKPCWTLLPRLHCDWRWGRSRADTPWYPAMRLYRQQTVGDWGPVIDQVIADLGSLSMR